MEPRIYSFDEGWRGAIVVVAFDLESALQRIKRERGNHVRESDIVCHEIHIDKNCLTQIVSDNLGDS